MQVGIPERKFFLSTHVSHEFEPHRESVTIFRDGALVAVGQSRGVVSGAMPAHDPCRWNVCSPNAVRAARLVRKPTEHNKYSVAGADEGTRVTRNVTSSRFCSCRIAKGNVRDKFQSHLSGSFHE